MEPRAGFRRSARSTIRWSGRAAPAEPTRARRTAERRGCRRQVPGAETLEFRDVEGVSADVAYLMAAGPGTASRIYKTEDGGATWTLQIQNTDPAGFYDCFAFWTATQGLTMADSVAGRFAGAPDAERRRPGRTSGTSCRRRCPAASSRSRRAGRASRPSARSGRGSAREARRRPGSWRRRTRARRGMPTRLRSPPRPREPPVFSASTSATPRTA